MADDSKLDAFTKNIGFTPNMIATFAQSSIAFNAWIALLGSLSKALGAKTRDSIGLAVSQRPEAGAAIQFACRGP